MKNRLWAAVALPAALAALSGCVYDDYSYGGWSGSYASVGVGYSSPGYYSPGYSPYGYGYSPVYYDAFYDNFYGPIYGGYWHNDGLFYYQTYFGGPWYCDYSRHFRRESFRGGNRYRFEDRRQNGETRPGSIADKIVRTDNPGWTGDRRNGDRGQGAPQAGFQGNPAPAPSGNRGGPVGGRDSIIGRMGRGGLEGGPGGSSGQAPAAAPPPPPQQVSPLNSVRGQNRGEGRRGENDGVRFQGGQSDRRSDGPQSDRPSSTPRSSPPPSQRQNSGSNGWGGGGGPKSEQRGRGGRN
jgi:hypothetical protein